MSALAPRNSYRIADEQGWLESSDNLDLSAAAVWATDYEDEDETTLPGRRVDVRRIELMSPTMEEEDTVVTPRQVRVLDESQVLPGEASFATVSLNQPFKESVLKPQESWEPISTSNVDDNRESKSASRVRLLDESQVLDGEASFATVLSGERTKAHSPITEFLVKTKLSVKQLVLAMLAVVSVLTLAVIVLLGVTRSGVVTVSSAPPPTTLEAASQSVSTSITETPESVLISNSLGGVSGSVSPTQPDATVEETQGVAAAKLIETSSSDNSRKEPSSDAKSGAVRQETLGEVNPAGARVSSPKERVIETKKKSDSLARKVVKEQVRVPEQVKTPVDAVLSEPRETLPEPATRKSEVPVTVENVETKTPPATGGGERPRTVTRRPNP